MGIARGGRRVAASPELCARAPHCPPASFALIDFMDLALAFRYLTETACRRPPCLIHPCPPSACTRASSRSRPRRRAACAGAGCAGGDGVNRMTE